MSYRTKLEAMGVPEDRIPGILNQTDQPIATEDTTTIEQESLVLYPVINTKDTKPHNNMSEPTMEQERVLTFGEKAVGITFNPGKNDQVENIKRYFANTIDLLNTYRVEAESQEAKRMLSVAIADAQAAQMWAVKAVTWQY